MQFSPSGRFPRGIAIMLLNKRSNVWKSVMLHWCRQIFDAAIQQYVLVDFVVSRRNIVADFNLFISAEPTPEQAQVPTRKITAMIYPTIQKPEPAIEIKSVHVRAANGMANFAFQFRRDALVGIDDQYPFVLPRNIFQRPILLARQFSVPSKLYNPSPSCLGDRLSSVCAPRINHHDLLRERYAGETVTQVRRFVLNREKHGQRRPRVGPLVH